jgi:hypothetical protein
MESKVLFEKMLDAFLKSEGGNYFFLSENVIAQTNEVSKEILEELKEKGLTPLPHRSSEFDFKIKEGFVYEIADQKTAERFFEAVTHKNPKKTFDELITETSLESPWNEYKRKIFSNALINWMWKNNIYLPGQILTPDIVLNIADTKSIPDEMLALMPKSCNNCKNTEGLSPLYFKSNVSIENVLMENELRKILLEKGIENFDFLGKMKKDLISACKCPKCESSNIEWDFK